MSRLPKFCVAVLALGIMAGLAAPAWADEATGTIRSMNAEKKEVTLKGIVSDTTYTLDKDGAVGMDGKKAKFADLKEGDKVSISFEKKGSHLMASEIRGLRKCQEVVGNVNDIFSEKREITLKGVVKNTTYELDKAGSVWISGKEGKLADLRPGDRVMITFEQRGDHYMAAEVRSIRSGK